MTARADDSRTVARRILYALRAGNRPALDAELERSARLPAVEALPADEAERWDLLSAVARTLLDRLPAAPAPGMDSHDVLVALLRHLAREAPAVA